MANWHTRKEHIKTCMIVLLGISAVFLGLGTGLFDIPLQAGGFGGAGAGVTLRDSDDVLPAAWPSAALVSLPNGAALGHRLSPAVREIYDRFASELGAAFASAEASVTVTLPQWRAALAGPGVFFHYDAALPGDVLARWLGAEASAVMGTVQTVYLSVVQGDVYLYYTANDGTRYRSRTAVSAERMYQLMAPLVPNGAVFGFQTTAEYGVDPYMVRFRADSVPAVYGYNAMYRVYAQLDTWLAALGFNQALMRYLDEGDSRTIVEDGASLRLMDSGLITFQDRGPSARLFVGDGCAIEIARRIADLLQPVRLEADVALTRIDEQDGALTIQFDYYIAGLPIRTEYPAVRVVISERYVRAVTFFARAYYVAEGERPVIPEQQAMAAAGGAALTLSLEAEAEMPPGRNSVALRPRWLLTETESAYG